MAVNVFHESRLEPKASPGGDLITRARRGEEAAFAALFEAHKRRVYGFCLRATCSPREAGKLAQEAFLRVFRKISTLRDESAFSAGLHRQAVNVLLMHLREKQAGLARTQLEELTTEFPRSPLFARELALLKKSADSAFASARGGS
jgi:RNA polymerase sigma factor (sigma-70 family)